MPTIRELFNKDVKGLTKGLYEGSKIYIESQGAINPPRLKALALSSPNGIAELAALTVAAAFGVPVGHANRPSDTIYNNAAPFAKPLVGLAGALAQRNLPNLISPKKSYYVKQTPAPYQIVNQIKNGIKTNPLGTLLTAARNELRDGTIREIFKSRTNVVDKYGTQYQHLGTRSKPLGEDKLFSKYYPVYGTADDLNQEKLAALKKDLAKKKGGLGGPKAAKLFKKFQQRNPGPQTPEEAFVKAGQVALKERTTNPVVNGKSKWDQINDDILGGLFVDIKKLDADNKKVNVPYVAFQTYGTNDYIILPGTISGLSEDVEPSWNTYKYVGSPFNTYRYSGVERSIKFDLKLYGNGTSFSLQDNLLKLRGLVFPNENVSEITTGGASILTGFNPNLVYLTISGYYKNMFGFIDGLNISVDDDVPWPTTSDNFEGVENTPHPAVVMVSISMKVIEATKYDKGFKTLAFNFQELDDELYKELNK